jgi:hypothetical protein
MGGQEVQSLLPEYGLAVKAPDTSEALSGFEAEEPLA